MCRASLRAVSLSRSPVHTDTGRHIRHPVVFHLQDETGRTTLWVDRRDSHGAFEPPDPESHSDTGHISKVTTFT